MPSVNEESMSWLERFVVLMYDNTSDTVEIKYETRRQHFAHKGRTVEAAPTQAAVKQYIKCTC